MGRGGFLFCMKYMESKRGLFISRTKGYKGVQEDQEIHKSSNSQIQWQSRTGSVRIMSLLFIEGYSSLFFHNNRMRD